MIKKIKNFKNKKQNRYYKNTENFKNKNQIRKNVKASLKNTIKNDGDNLVKKRIKEQIQLLLAVYKQNIIGTPVKITNIGAKSKKTQRPKVIIENESGINKDVVLNKKVLAFRNRALAFKYKLTLNRLNSQLQKEYVSLQNVKLQLESDLIPNDIESYETKYATSFTIPERKHTIKRKILNILTEQYKHAVNIIKTEPDSLGYNKISKIKINKKKWRKFLKIQKYLTKINNQKDAAFLTIIEENIAKKKLILQNKKYFRLFKKRCGTLKWLITKQRLRRSILKAYSPESENKHIVELKKLHDKFIKEEKEPEPEEIIIKDYSIKLLKKYKEKTNNTPKDLENNYKTLLNYLTKINSRTNKGLSKRLEKGKINGYILKGIEKQIRRVTQNSRKKVITLVLNQQQEQNNQLVVKVLLNILRGLGQQKSVSGNIILNKYLCGLKNFMENKVGIYETLAENVKMRMMNEILTKKEFAKILETQEELMQKYIAYCNIARKFPKKWVKPEIFRPFFAEFKAKKRDYKRNKKRVLRLLGTDLKNKYNVVNNVVNEDNRIYNLRLPKKRNKVPTLKQIYKGLKKVGVPYYKTTKGYKLKKIRKLIKKQKREQRLKKLGIFIPKKKKKKVKKKVKKKTKLKIGVLRIKIRRRNMFLVFRDRKTNKVEAVTTARKEYYRIYNTKEVEPGNKKRRDSKETVVKAKGPIGRYISTDHFRSRVLTQAFLDLRHKLKYKILDIEIEKKYKKRFVQTIYKKYWYVFKSQGLFRMCKFAKNKPHGRMRKKKARRI
jgi:hypothetical protein